METQAAEFTPSISFRWRFAAGFAAFIMTRTRLFYFVYTAFALWTVVSAILRLKNHDMTWWVDGVVFLAVLVSSFAFIAIYCLVKETQSQVFRSGEPVRAMLSDTRLLLSRGDSVDAVSRTDISRVRSGFGLIFIEAAQRSFITPRESMSRSMVNCLHDDVKANTSSANSPANSAS